MEEVIDRLLEGNFDYENGSLDFSCTKLELSIRKGESVQGSFRIYTGSGRYTRGSVISSDGRMECLTPEFVGSEEEIFYCFHGENMEEGEVIKGEFYVLSNQGEYYLPFVVTVEYTVLTSSLGNIRNLFHFANLVKTSPTEAVGIFYSPEFRNIFNGSDGQYYDYYRGLSAFPGNRQNIEEFLIGINKKQKIEYLTDVTELRVEEPEGTAFLALTITRNGWGYTQLRVETEGGFVFSEIAVITEEDFTGNMFRLPVYVDSGRLHAGNNYGAVRLYSGCDLIEIPVRVKSQSAGKAGRQSLNRNRQLLQLMQFYQAFRLKKISTDTWMKESGRLVETMLAADERDVQARLFQAQLLITEERFNEAQWILEHVADLLEPEGYKDPVTEAYYLYLTTLIHREETYVDQITEQVERLYRKNRNEWRIGWLLLYLSEEYNRSFTKKWMFLEEQYERGCSSPVLYIEALLLVNLSPALLIRLGAFERQVLWFGARNGMLSEDVVLQLLYLASREKEYAPLLYRTLKICYENRADSRILQEICSQLIKGGKTGRAYFKWYKRGVEQELRITRLYEFYLMSADRDTVEALPRMVLMYFSYHSKLDYELTAFLYANVHRNRAGFPELYENYRNQMEQFILEQLGKKRINRDLAYLYKQLLEPRMLTPQLAECLAELVFMNCVQTQQQGIRFAVICSQGKREAEYYPLTDGRAYVPMPGTEDRLLFEDGSHNRYISAVHYTMEKLMLPGKPVKLIAPMVGNSRNLNLYLCMNGREPAEVNSENEVRFGYLLQDEGIEPEIKREIGMRLMKYHYENDRIKELDAYLEQIQPELLTARERNEVLHYLVLRGRESIAYEWLVRFGPWGMDAKTLMRLCSRLVRSNEFVEDAVLLESVTYAFRKGKYDEYCLRYLTLYLKGMTKELRDVYKAAEDFNVDTYELCEKILIQMLFTGSFVGEKMQIFRSYVAGGAKPEVEAAFLSQCAYDYYVKDRLTDGYVFEEMARLQSRGERLHRVCKLGYIKYYAENRASVSAETEELLRGYIRELLADGIRLRMFLEFADLDDMIREQLADRTIVEYKAQPGVRAVLHYCVEHTEGEEPEYLTEEMNEVYGGVCFKDFVLFFGERLQYYIVEEKDGQEQLTESATIQKSDTGSMGIEGRFNLLNDISISSTLQDYETVDKLLAEYVYQDFMREGLFTLR